MPTATKAYSAIRSRTGAMIVALCMFLYGTLASAQTTSNTNILIVPFGIWQLCESPAGSGSPSCSGFTAGSEQFLLMIKATQPQTTTYLYTVVATMLDGSTRAISGQLKRADNNAGYTATSVFFGGVAVSFNTTVEEATVSAVQTGTGTFHP